MTEEDYIFIRNLELENQNILRRVSDIDGKFDPKEVQLLHEDIEKILDKLVNVIKNRVVKSNRALILLEIMKRGYIDILVGLDELID